MRYQPRRARTWGAPACMQRLAAPRTRAACTIRARSHARIRSGYGRSTNPIGQPSSFESRHAKPSQASRALTFTTACLAARSRGEMGDPSYHQTATAGGWSGPAGSTGQLGPRRRGRPGENAGARPATATGAPTHVHVRARALAAGTTGRAARTHACSSLPHLRWLLTRTSASIIRALLDGSNGRIDRSRVSWTSGQRAGWLAGCDGVVPSTSDTLRRPVRSMQDRVVVHRTYNCDCLLCLSMSICYTWCDVTRRLVRSFWPRRTVGRRCHQRTHRPIAGDAS
jgi:hypothetical protein